MSARPDLLTRENYVLAPTGLILPERIAEDRHGSPRVPKAIDLFSGCGGFSCGVMEAGFHVVAAVEFDPLAAFTYMINLCRQPVHIHFQTDELEAKFTKLVEGSYKQTGTFPVAGSGFISGRPDLHSCDDHIFIWDAHDLTGEFILEQIGMAVGELDFVFGSPPCQGYSRAGKRNPKDQRNNLVFDFARLIVELQPKSMCMENVPGILDQTTATGQPVMDAVQEILERGDYSYRKAMDQMLELQHDGLTVYRGSENASKAKPAQPDDDQLGLF